MGVPERGRRAGAEEPTAAVSVAAAAAGLLRCRSMSRTPLIAATVALLALLGLVAGCVATPADTPSQAPASVAATPVAPAEPAAPAGPEVTITTEKGAVVVTLNAVKAPATSANFLKLVKSGFYDGLRFHRVEPGFVVQGGDPLTKGLSRAALMEALTTKNPPVGTGGPGWAIPLEQTGLLHDRGVIAMARSNDPDSAGSQFYITLDAAHHLDGSYAVFGAVTQGMDVVDALAVGDKIVSIAVTKD
jgi:peptidyl-prolyl cis-trans isomerase B (cyclophilin B)